jgi:hypothetical protein
MAEVLTVNQGFQIGPESTAGTSVAASKLVECFGWEDGMEVDSKFFTGSGRKYPSTQEVNKEWHGGSFDGEMDFNGLIYPLCSVLSNTTPTAHGGSASAKDWIYTPPVSGNASPKTYTMERGDSVRARKWTYGIFTKWGYKLSRDDATTSGEFLGRKMSDGITLTSSPTAIALAPMTAAMFNVYVDTTSGGLGGSQLLRVIEVEFEMSNVYGAAWFINRSESSWVVHKDLVPECTVSVLLEADSTGMGERTHLQSGATRYLRVHAAGNQIASDGPGSVTNEFIHDMAVKWEKPDKYSDSDGVYGIKWSGKIVEDLSWGSGTAHKVTLTNLLTAL